MNLDLSVIVACYNCGRTITRCLDSIPKNAGVEIILIEDHSVDNTRDVIQGYIESHDNEKIICIENEQNIGAGRTRNRGVEIASKKYITFLDSDDEFSESFLESLYTRINEDYECIIFDAFQASDDVKSPLKMFYTDCLHEGVLDQKETLVYVKGATWGKIYKREIIQNNRVVFGDIKRNEDMIFTKTAIANCHHIYYIEKPLYEYIENAQSLMHDKDLLTERNAMVAVNAIKEPLLSKGFSKEFNSIYFLEILYSTTLTLIKLGKPRKECKNHFKKLSEEYDSRDPYRKMYYRKYRVAYFLFSIGLYEIFKLALRK